MSKTLGRPKAASNYTETEKQLIIDTINEFALFNGTNQEIIQSLQHKLGRNIGETTSL